jgi:hypothetical protein
MKINDMKPINFLFYKNKFINEVPKENYNSWQLIRMKKENEEVVASSKFKKSNDYIKNVDFENIFSNGQKINLTNYHQLDDSLINDFRFLKKNKIIDFNLINYLS